MVDGRMAEGRRREPATMREGGRVIVRVMKEGRVIARTRKRQGGYSSKEGKEDTRVEEKRGRRRCSRYD